MKAIMLLAALLGQMARGNQPPPDQPGAMRYERALHVQTGAGQACAVLGGQIFPDAAPSLADLRIFATEPSGTTPREIPYAITLSDAASDETQSARVLNLGVGAGKIFFDLEMPARAYSDVALLMDPAVKNFVATATVSGSGTPDARDSTALGSFTLFDLSSQHLSRDTTLPLPESVFRYLHVSLKIVPAPGSAAAVRFAPQMVEGAEVPPSREAQILYTTVAETSSMVIADRESRAAFLIPARVPVERVSFQLAPGFKGDFSRDVRITALAVPEGKQMDARAPLPERVGGTIQRVHATEAGRAIDTEELAIPAILGANLQDPARVDVDIEDGEGEPLPIASVRLQMRRRELCFDAPASATTLTLFYGDPGLPPAVYDYERLFVPSDHPLAAQFGPEAVNRAFRAAAPQPASFNARHPQAAWIAGIGVLCALGIVALKSARNAGA